MGQVVCDSCNEIVKMPKLKRTVHQGLVYEYYWNCSECDHKHISYYTDKKIRRDINRQKKRWERHRLASSETEERKRLAEIKMEDKLVDKDMNVLKNRITKTLT